VELYFHSPNTPSWRGAQLERRGALVNTDLTPWMLDGDELTLKSLCSNRLFGKDMALLVLVTTTWHFSGLRIEETYSKYGGRGYLWMYLIKYSGQPTRSGPPAWGLGKGLTTLHHKEKQLVTKCYTERLGWSLSPG
jgi:hypothetical protein